MFTCLRRCTRKNSQIDKALNNSKSSDSSVSKRGLLNLVEYIKNNDDKIRYCVKHDAAKVIVDAVKNNQELAPYSCLALYYMAKLIPEGADACMKAGAPLMAVTAIIRNTEDVNVCINASDLIRKLAQSSDNHKQIIKGMTFGQSRSSITRLAIMFARITHEGRETTSQRDKEDKDYVLDRLDALSEVLYDDESEDDEGEEEDDEGEDPRKHPNGNPEGPNNEGGGRRRRKRATQKKKKTKRRNTRKGLKYV